MNQTLFAASLPESIIKQYSIRVKASRGINFGQGIPSFPTAPHIVAAAQKALQDPGVGVYPNFLGTLELRTAITDRINTAHEIQTSPEKNVLVTVGAMEATAATIFSLVHNGDRVGVITPDYCNHFPQLLLARAEIVELPMLETQEWNLDFNLIARELKKGLKLLVLTNPNNPTGAVLSKGDLAELIRLAAEYGTWVLTDETYSFLTYSRKYVSLLDFWTTYDRLITVRSFSKEYAMTGWRVGYIIAGSEFISLAARTHDALTGCVPKISQLAAVAALRESQEIVHQYRSVLERRKNLVLTQLATFNEMITYIPPRGAYYIFPRYTIPVPSLKLTERLLSEGNVAVVPGSVFGKSGEYHFRISFAVDDTVITKGLSVLNRALKGVFSK